MRRGLIFGAFMLIVSIAAIVLLCLRPGLITGPNERSLAYSLRSANNAGQTGECEEADARWRCTVFTSGGAEGSGVESLYAVDVDDWGCWAAREIRPGRGEALELEGCITIRDLIRSGD